MHDGVCKCGEGVCCKGCGSPHVKARGLCNACYLMSKKEAQQDGQWEPYVDATPALAHLDVLRERGVTLAQVVRITGLHHTTVYRMVPGARVRTETMAKILAISPPLVPVQPVVTESALGAARRLQALSALGWSLGQVAQRCSVHHAHLCKIAKGAVTAVLPDTRAEVERVYEEMSHLPGPSQLVRATARARGWVPPLAWDEDLVDDDGNPTNHIDNPHAVPQGVARENHQPFTQAYLEYLQLGYANDEIIAERMGIEPRSLRRMVNRSRSLQGVKT